MPIYCDESGNNGNDLLQQEQPYFVYAALNIEESEAALFQKYLRNKYSLQGKEPKGINMVRSIKGMQAIQELYLQYSNQVKIVYHHKKYALACKFFEYIFEPAISFNNILFYRSNFHRFIANVVFDGLMFNDGSAEHIFIEFQKFLKGENFHGLFMALRTNQKQDFLTGQICEFASLHKDRILEDIQINGQVEPWILDLTQSALYDLLVKWGEEIGELTVVCDTSHALKYVVENNIVYEPNQEVRDWDPLGHGKTPVNFKLSNPITLTSSKYSPGIQLADIFASSVFFTLKNPEHELSNKLRPYIQNIVYRTGNKCIMPQPNLFSTPGTQSFDFGIVALTRLIEFSKIDRKNATRMFIQHIERQIKKFGS
jgi:hypothetical protein